MEADKLLWEETSFSARVAAIDRLEFDILPAIAGQAPANGNGKLPALARRAEALIARLEAVDAAMLGKLHRRIQSGECLGDELRQEILRYVASDIAQDGRAGAAYDDLDAFVNGLLLGPGAPGAAADRHPEMVSYQPTPARIVLEMLDQSTVRSNDVFYDLGSGFGRVVMLVNLLTGARAKGVEVEPSYCEYATRCAAALNLSRVECINADARDVDYSDGTVFFLYTSFEGVMLETVLDRIRRMSIGRTITLYSYGPGTADVSRQDWLEQPGRAANWYELATFRSISGGLGE